MALTRRVGTTFDVYLENFPVMPRKKTFGVRRQEMTEYVVWQHAKDRCNNPKHVAFHRYGGRGIKMCPEWNKSFEAFYAYLGPRPEGRTLDRIDNDKGYEPGNVRWATIEEQHANREKVKLNRMNVAEWIRLNDAGMSAMKIGPLFGTSGSVVSRYLRKYRSIMKVG